jgi:hypothetical protein
MEGDWQNSHRGHATDEVGEDNGLTAAAGMAATGTDNVALMAGDMMF